ncbi:hypothetical protein D9613_010450 [Agrocybe pediades]|uniref:Glycosyltransferase n=1 Tax=Agrocybe pediades TaxID=84607 RepID=A0A8H4QH73_9AGAR|nr:hypothetical protein D9613_010450 [Agrocybe pediades]
MSQLDSHIVFTVIPAYGHIRAVCILVARLVKENRNLVATVFIPPNYLDSSFLEVEAELGQSATDEAIRKRIRILSTFSASDGNLMDLSKPTAESYTSYYEALVQEKPILCPVKGTPFEAVLAPTLVIADFFAGTQFEATRKLTGHRVPIVAAITAHASSIIRLFGPESHGGIGDLSKMVEAEAERTGKKPEEVGDEVLQATSGKVVKIAGIPDMYDYEYFPQVLPFSGAIPFMTAANKILPACDGVVMASSYAFENESLQSMKSWFADWNKELFAVGPLLPAGYGFAKQSARGADEVEAFMEKALKEYGEKSISFGTIFWSTRPEFIEEVLEALLEKKFPFVFAYASPFANLPEELLQRVKASGLGLISKWTPQQYILSHPATGWFLSHCGHNSIMESLGCGVPLICWPFQADQPAAAAYLTEYLNVAIELIEVRTGEKGLKPLLRNGRVPKGTREAVGIEIREVIDLVRGAKGDELRRNAESFKIKFAEVWEENGISRKEAQALLEKFRLVKH